MHNYQTSIIIYDISLYKIRFIKFNCDNILCRNIRIYVIISLLFAISVKNWHLFYTIQLFTYTVFQFSNVKWKRIPFFSVKKNCEDMIFAQVGTKQTCRISVHHYYTALSRVLRSCILDIAASFAAYFEFDHFPRWLFSPSYSLFDQYSNLMTGSRI